MENEHNMNFFIVTNRCKALHFIGCLLYFSIYAILLLLFSQNYSNNHHHPNSRILKSNSDESHVDLDVTRDELNVFETNPLIEAFLIEIHQKEYVGKWKYISSNSTINDDPITNLLKDFKNSNGDVIIKFTVNLQSSDLQIIADYSIKDGGYKENWINMIQEFYYNPRNNIHDVDFRFHEIDGMFTTSLVNNKRCLAVFMRYKLYNLVESRASHASRVQLDFRTLQTIMTGMVTYPELGFDIEFETVEGKNFSYDRKVANMTIILTFIGVLHLYYTLQLIRDCLLNRINPKSFSPAFFCINMIWNSNISIGCVYLAINSSNNFNDYAITALVYFLSFSVFEIRLLFIAYKSQDDFANITNESAFRRKVLKFYLMLYVSIFFSMLVMYVIIFYKLALLFVVTLTFIPQIIHNIRVNITRNRLPYLAYAVYSINKLFIPLYFRMCPYNFFGVEPDKDLSLIMISIILFEIIFQILQAKCGARFFIPKKFRSGYYDYYKTCEDLRSMNTDIEKTACSICLNPIISQGNQYLDRSTGNSPQDHLIQQKEDFPAHKQNRSCLRNLFAPKQSANKVMMTPCNHLFHPECLKMWGQHKNECPICRKVLPLLE